MELAERLNALDPMGTRRAGVNASDLWTTLKSVLLNTSVC